MAEHSPSPWVAYPCRGPEAAVVRANLPPTDDSPAVAYCHPRRASSPGTANANARLIAAAPDLLDACQQAHALLNSPAMNPFRGEARNALAAAVIRLADVIARATGQPTD